MSVKKPSVVIMPGGWHRAGTWNNIVKLLEGQEFEAVSLDKPTIGTRDIPLAEDIAVVRAAIEEECALGNDVLVVSHSSGSAPANAAYKGLVKREYPAGSEKAGVIGAVAVAAVMIEQGNPTSPTKTSPQNWHYLGDDDCSHTNPDDYEHPARAALFHDCSNEAVRAVQKLLDRQSIRHFIDPVPYAGWRHVPITYVVCEQDRAFLTEWQDGWIAANRDSLEGRLSVARLNSSHSPFLSMPEQLVEVIVKAAKSYSSAGDVGKR